MNQDRDYVIINMWELLLSCLRRWWVLVLGTLLVGGLVFGCTELFVAPSYESTLMLYVKSSDNDDGEPSISAAELTASKNLVDVYKVILNTRDTLDTVIAEAKLPYDYKELGKMLRCSAVDDTQVLEVTVTSTSAEEAQLIAETVGRLLPQTASVITEGPEAKIIEHAKLPTEKAAPNTAKNTVLGATIGLALAFFTLCAIEISKIRQKTRT